MTQVKVNTTVRAAQVDAASINTESRTVEVTFATEYPVVRYDWRNDRYFLEVLGFKEGEADISRFSGSAPVLDNHNQWGGARGTLGVVESAKLNGNNGTAVMRFSKRADVEPIYQDVVDGILRTVSVGYVVKKYQDTGKRGENDLPIYRAVQWEAREISLAPIPADPMSRVRSGDEAAAYDVTVEGERSVSPPAAAGAAAPPVEPPVENNETAQRNAAAADGKNPDAPKPQKRQKMKDVNEIKSQRKAKENELAALDNLTRSGGELSEEQSTRQAALVDEIQALDKDIVREEQRLAILAARAAGGEGASTADMTERRVMAKRATIAEQIVRMADGKPLEGIVGEMTQEARSMNLGSGQGISIPTSYFEAIRTGTADNFQIDAGQGSAFKPTEVPSFIEKLSAPFAIERLGATSLFNLVGEQQFPKQTAHGSATAQTEVGNTANAGLQLGELVMDGRRYTAKTEYSKKMLVATPLAADTIIAGLLRRGFDRKINFDAFTGATGGENIVGFFNQAGVSEPTITNSTSAAEVFGKLYKAIIDGEADPNLVKYVISSIGWDKAQQAPKVTGVSELLQGGRIHNAEVVTSPYLQNVSAGVGRVLLGDFSQAIFGYWGSFDLVIDPYTLAENNKIKLVGNMYVDLGLMNESAFAKNDDISYT
jgi:HK97 family phage major capsid protein